MTKRRAVNRPLLWIRDAVTPVFVLNPRRLLAAFNHGCEALTGWLASEMLGRKVETVSEDDIHSAAALLSALNPPLEVWQGETASVTVDLPRRQAAPLVRQVQFWPMKAPDGSLLAILGIVGEASSPRPLAISESATSQLHAELVAIRRRLRERYGEKSLIARGPQMLRVLDQIHLCQNAWCPVAITGERGVGKEHVARTIHLGSPASRRAFVSIDCRQTPSADIKRAIKHLLSEGPGATTEELLEPGTLYFGEIDALGIDVQERLTEYLAQAPHPPPARVIASTSEPMDARIAENKFLDELWQRLTPVVLRIPPLRERADDFPLLTQFLLEECNRGSDRQVAGFSDEAWQRLQRYHWPGNVAELQQVILESHAVATEGMIQSDQLPFRFRAGEDAQRLGPPRRASLPPLDAFLEQTERTQIELAITQARGNMTAAAELLQIPRARLYRRIEQLGIQVE